MHRPLVAPTLACLIAAATPAFAAPALDPQADSPYVWRVVVQVRPHPMLSPTFRDQLVRDITTALQPAVGELAKVEAVDLETVRPDKWEPLWKLFAEKGWPGLDTPAARKLTGAKTHFVRVELRNGKYLLEARQLDGDTGLTSPLLRKQETDAAEKVGRIAGLMIARDFGPVATLGDYDLKAGTATVRFRAAAVGGLERFVQVGDVLSVAAVKDPPRAAPRYGLTPKTPTPEPPAVRDGVPRPFTLLRLTELLPNGSYKCQVLTRFSNPFPFTTGIAGFRGMKLATVEGPVAVKIVRPVSGEPVSPGGLIRVRATDTGFGGRPDPRDALELRDGVFRSPRPMRNVACVVVGVGSVKEEPFPVPVLGAGVPFPIPFEPNEADAARASFAQACTDLRARVAETRIAQVALFDGLAALITKGDYQAALDRATKGLEQLQATEKELSAEIVRLRGEPGAKDAHAEALLNSSDTLLQGLKLGEPAVKQRIDELKAAIEKSRDPARFEREFRGKELAARIKQHLEQGEGEAALALYDQLLALTGGQADLKAARDKLAGEWEPKADEQKRAREYVAGEWRKATTVEELKAGLPSFQESADVLLKYDDKHGLRGLLASLEPAYTRIKEQADLLDANSTADRQALTDLQTITNALRDVETRARERLKKLDPPKDEKPAGM